MMCHSIGPMKFSVLLYQKYKIDATDGRSFHICENIKKKNIIMLVDIDFVSCYNFDFWVWNFSDSVVFCVFHFILTILNAPFIALKINSVCSGKQTMTKERLSPCFSKRNLMYYSQHFLIFPIVFEFKVKLHTGCP